MQWFTWLQHHYEIIAAVIILVASAISSLISQRENPFKNLRWRLAGPSVEALKNLFGQVKEMIGPDSKDVHVRQNRAHEVVKEVTTEISSGSRNAAEKLGEHLRLVFAVIAGGEDKGVLKMWRIFGAVISMILLLLFIYADVIQGVNNLSMLYLSETVSLPVWVKNIVPSLIMSSVGTALTLSFIMADARGVTHFLPWTGRSWKKGEEEKEVSIRRVVFWIALLTFGFTVLILAALASPRIMGTESAQFPEKVGVLVYESAAIAQVLIIVPMLVTTALLFWGVVGVIIGYGGVVGLLRLFGEIIAWVFFLVEKTIEILEPTSKIFSYFVLILVATVFATLGLLVGTFLVFMEGLTHAVTAVVWLVFYPFIVLSDMVRWLKGVFK